VFWRVDLDDELAHVTALVGVQVPGGANRGERGGERERQGDGSDKTCEQERLTRGSTSLFCRRHWHSRY